MCRLLSVRRVLLSGTAVVALSAAAYSQSPVTDPAADDALPNPNGRVIRNWGELPDDRVWGSTAGVDIGPDGHVWAYDRCGVNSCVDSTVDPIVKLDRDTGELLASFGGGMIIFPHGFHVDRQGNVWVTDGRDDAPPGGGRGRGGPNPAATRGHQVFKFSPAGELLMTLGRPGGASGDACCFQPNDVITNSAGEIFVSEGHTAGGRIHKFASDGTWMMAWGGAGSDPGQFNVPHGLAFDSRGRLFVADRANHRIQIFDQDGNFIDEWAQFSRVSGLFIDADDDIYAIDSESSDTRHPNWKTGVRIGKTTEDRVLAFIPPHENGESYGAAGEGVAVDRDGNVYAAEGPLSRQAAGGGLTKYVRQ
jgi:sugar lactone lactonase YvrE